MPDETDRRSFMVRVIKGTALIMGGLTTIPGVGMLLSPILNRGQRKTFKVLFTNPTDAQSTTFVPARLEGQDDTAPGVFAKRGADGKPVVLSSVCTHAGCPVTWKPGESHFYCPCHHGLFDSEGKNISGPPPKPLTRLAAIERNGEIYVEEAEV